MAQQTRENIKSNFQSGDIPTEGNYIDLIDSSVSIKDHNSGSIVISGSLDVDLLIAKKAKIKGSDVTIENGNISMSGNLIATGSISAKSNLIAKGSITASGDIIASGSNFVLGHANSNGIRFAQGNQQQLQITKGNDPNTPYLTINPAGVTLPSASFLDITNTSEATDVTGDTGALRVEGGASIAKKVFVGTDLFVSSSLTASSIVGTGTGPKSTSFNDGNITNVGTIDVDTIRADVDSAVEMTMGSNGFTFSASPGDQYAFNLGEVDANFVYMDASENELLHMDAGLSRIGISDTSPVSKLDIGGDLNVQSHITASANISSSLASTSSLSRVESKDLILNDVKLTTTFTELNHLDGLTSNEANQIKNIGSKTISNTQWGYVGNMNQNVTTSSEVIFNKVSTPDLRLSSASNAVSTQPFGGKTSVTPPTNNFSIPFAIGSMAAGEIRGGSNAHTVTVGNRSDILTCQIIISGDHRDYSFSVNRLSAQEFSINCHNVTGGSTLTVSPVTVIITLIPVF